MSREAIIVFLMDLWPYIRMMPSHRAHHSHGDASLFSSHAPVHGVRHRLSCVIASTIHHFMVMRLYVSSLGCLCQATNQGEPKYHSSFERN